MRPTLSCLCAPLVVVLATLPSAAGAQTVPSPYTYLERSQEIGVYAGYTTAGTGRFGYGPSGGLSVGARYGVELTGPLSFEGVAGVIDGTRDVIDPGRVEGDRVIGEADSQLLTIDARLKFSITGRRAWHRVAPFFVAGGGIALDLASGSEVEDILLPEDVFEFGTSFYGTVGGGARWFVTDRIALRGDAVFSLWQIDTPPGFSDPDRGFVEVDDGEWIGGGTFTLALLYRW